MCVYIQWSKLVVLFLIVTHKVFQKKKKILLNKVLQTIQNCNNLLVQLLLKVLVYGVYKN